MVDTTVKNILRFFEVKLIHEDWWGYFVKLLKQKGIRSLWSFWKNVLPSSDKVFINFDSPIDNYNLFIIFEEGPSINITTPFCYGTTRSYDPRVENFHEEIHKMLFGDVALTHKVKNEMCEGYYLDESGIFLHSMNFLKSTPAYPTRVDAIKDINFEECLQDFLDTIEENLKDSNKQIEVVFFAKDEDKLPLPIQSLFNKDFVAEIYIEKLPSIGEKFKFKNFFFNSVLQRIYSYQEIY